MQDHTYLCTADDFSYEEVCRSFRGTSFDPEKRARHEIASWVTWINGRFAEFMELCENDEQRAYLDEQFPIFKERSFMHIYKITAARGQCVSSMIAGPANFPVRRAEKAHAREGRCYKEFEEWDKKARTAILKGIEARKSPEQAAQESIDKVKRIIMNSHLDSSYGRTRCYGKLQTWAGHNPPEVVKEALDFLKGWQDTQLGGKGFTARHKVWGLVEVCRKEAPGICSREKIGEIEIVRNADLDRVQIFFPGKPDAGTLEKLRRGGWRWSPKNKAWQRKNTSNAYTSAKDIVGA